MCKINMTKIWGGRETNGSDASWDQVSYTLGLENTFSYIFK